MTTAGLWPGHSCPAPPHWPCLAITCSSSPTQVPRGQAEHTSHSPGVPRQRWEGRHLGCVPSASVGRRGAEPWGFLCAESAPKGEGNAQQLESQEWACQGGAQSLSPQPSVFCLQACPQLCRMRPQVPLAPPALWVLGCLTFLLWLWVLCSACHRYVHPWPWWGLAQLCSQKGWGSRLA